MFGSVMLDVAIGLILVYLILSLVCTAFREGVEAVLKNRATFLHQGICELLHNEALTKDLYEHPLVGSLYKGSYEEARGRRALPSYIPSRNFALALLDMTARGRDASQVITSGPGATVLSVATLRQNIAQIGDPKVQRVLLSAIDLSEGEIASVQAAVETWFNSSMDRVSGWYKRRSQWILIGVGMALAGIANIDTMRLALSFYKDPSERQAAVAMAGSFVKNPPAGVTTAPDTKTDSVNRVQQATQLWTKLDSLNLPIGWPDPEFNLMRVFGWLLTALAISLGAPFWFDILSKIMSVRGSPKPEATPADPSSTGTARTSVTVVTPGTTAAGLPGATAGSLPGATAGAPLMITSGGTPPGDDYREHQWSSGHPKSGVI